MPITGPLTHIDISVGYPEKSIPFYRALLEALGYTRWVIDQPGFREPDPERATWSVKLSETAHFAIEVRPARIESRDRKYDRYEPGPHHMAFHADGRETVDCVHEAMVAAGADVLDRRPRRLEARGRPHPRREPLDARAPSGTALLAPEPREQIRSSRPLFRPLFRPHRIAERIETYLNVPA